MRNIHTRAHCLIAGAVVDVVGYYTDPVCRAMIATCVSKEELGKVYALIATVECVDPFLVSQAYASLFEVPISLQIGRFGRNDSNKISMLLVSRQLNRVYRELCFFFHVA